MAKAIEEHARLGLPVYIWRNGKVVELSSDKDVMLQDRGVESPDHLPRLCSAERLFSSYFRRGWARLWRLRFEVRNGQRFTTTIGVKPDITREQVNQPVERETASR